MAIKYTNISYKDYIKLSYKKSKKQPYCVEFPDGSKGWFVKGLYHREDGHAFITAHGLVCWFFNGKEYPFKEWIKLTPIPDEEKIFLRLKYS